ncbi:MAG: RNA polymerase sigma factor [Bryobacteraceae bacterium]
MTDELALRARGGDRVALEELVTAIQEPLYRFAVRMLWHPEDARDATQEILIRVITHLGGFRGESSFRTWMYRVASNYLLDARRSRVEREEYTFERFGREIDQGIAAPVEDALLIEEIKIGCTHGMLLCLDRPHRMAYILGEILEFDGAEGARILEIEAATFRKRLSRARADLAAFMRAHCGLIDAARPCRCRRRVATAIATGRVDPQNLLFARAGVRVRIEKLEALESVAALYQSHRNMGSPPDLAADLRRLLDEAASGPE